MITCPHCGAPTRVLEARPASRDQLSYVRRRRECTKCRRRVTTSEVIVEERARGSMMLIPTSTMETMLRLAASALAPGAAERAAELVNAFLGKAGRSKL